MCALICRCPILYRYILWIHSVYVVGGGGVTRESVCVCVFGVLVCV